MGVFVCGRKGVQNSLTPLLPYSTTPLSFNSCITFPNTPNLLFIGGLSIIRQHRHRKRSAGPTEPGAFFDVPVLKNTVKQSADKTVTAADAMICTSDLIAMGVLHTLHDTGVAVPAEVAVTGFDDIPTAAQFIPPITTFRQPLREMVRLAFQAIIEHTASQTIYLPGELFTRQTA